jgi:hypothetical protein
MSRNFKSEYTGFGRQILSEFMTQDQLKELDNKYNQAKLNRNVRLATNKLNDNIMENYFNGGWTDENIELLAKFQNYEQGADIDLANKSRKELEEAIIEHGNIGDTEAKKIFENDTFLIYVSIDSSIEVLNCIHKKHLNNSQCFEII